MEKNYVAPEAVVIVFEEKDFLQLSVGNSGETDNQDWNNGNGRHIF